MIYTLAIDPGLHSPGVALFADAALVCVANTDGATNTTINYAKRSMIVSREIALWCVGRVSTLYKIDVIMEWPMIRPEGKSPGDPNQLTPLAAIGVSVATWLEGSARLGEVYAPQPHQWTGSIPKKCQMCKQVPGKKSCRACQGSAWRTPRGRMIKAALSAGERGLVPDQNDIIDAVGIGLWKLGRLKQAEPGIVSG